MVNGRKIWEKGEENNKRNKVEEELEDEIVKLEVILGRY